jgi:molybdopterin synthase sulfur carrier subunit
MHWKLFADLAEIAGDREIAVDLTDEEPTVDDALTALFSTHPELEARVLTEDGELKAHLNLLKNGDNVGSDTGLSTPLQAGDELALFPPVSGG